MPGPVTGFGCKHLSWRRRGAGQKPSRPRRWQPGLEALEPRYALNCVQVQGPRDIIINCAPGADDVRITESGGVVTVRETASAKRFDYACANFDSITVNTGAGNDVVTAEAICAGKDLNVQGGGGNDRFIIDDHLPIPGPNPCLPGLFSRIDLFGEIGLDTVAYRNSPAPGAPESSFVVTERGMSHRRQATGNPCLELTYDSVNDLDFQFGGGNDLIAILSTPLGVPVTTRGGAGHDTFTIGSPSNTLNAIQGALTVNGEAGTDLVNVNDQGNPPGAHTYTLTATTLRWLTGGPPPLTYGTLERLVVNTSGGMIGVQGTALDTATVVNGGPSGDAITVGTAANSLSSLGRDLTINGLGGSDTLHVTDVAATGPHAFRLTAAYLDRDATRRVSYGTVEALVLTAGNQPDTITVESTAGGVATTVHAGLGNDGISVFSTAAAAPLTVRAGGGDDTITVGNGGLSLGSIRAPVTVHGDESTAGDMLRVTDQSATGAGHFYFLADAGLARDGIPVALYTTVEGLAFTGSNQGETIYLAGTAAGTPVVVNGGGGGDTLVGPDQVNTWTVTGTDAGTLSCCPAPVSFLAVESLEGGGGNDTFDFRAGQYLTGHVHGGPGRNTLAYGTYTSDVAVNLPLYAATGVGAYVYEIQNVTGGAGDDVLVGDHQSNVLDGGPGRDLVIGGGLDWATGQYSFLPDVLRGGGGEDILIAGFTLWDTIPELLEILRLVWAFQASFEERTGWLSPLLDPAWAVYSNQVTNTLTGGAGDDWFFGVRNRDLVTEPLTPREDASWVQLLL